METKKLEKYLRLLDKINKGLIAFIILSFVLIIGASIKYIITPLKVFWDCTFLALYKDWLNLYSFNSMLAIGLALCVCSTLLFLVISFGIMIHLENKLCRAKYREGYTDIPSNVIKRENDER